MEVIYTIGHGNKTIEDFILELHSFDIQYLIDIRSKPYSKFYPDFSQHALKAFVERAHIQYVFMGNELGGLPVHDLSCFTWDGKVDYDKLKEKGFFREGLHRLMNASSKGYKICIMCSEKDPTECHRSKVIGEALKEMGAIVHHITDISKYKTQNHVINDLTKGLGRINLFGETESLTSKKAYLEV